MTDEVRCPVCGKVGIPDYHAEDTVCPQCGSNLSIFRVIDQIPQATVNKRKVWIPVAAAAIVAVAATGGILMLQPSLASTVEDQSNQIACLQDSIHLLKSELETSTIVAAKLQSQPVGFKYVVRKGDSFWSISKRFYHTGTRYEEVAAANGLDSNSMLNVGDTIIIK